MLAERNIFTLNGYTAIESVMYANLYEVMTYLSADIAEKETEIEFEKESLRKIKTKK